MFEMQTGIGNVRFDLRDADEITEAETIEAVLARNKTSLYLYAP